MIGRALREAAKADRLEERFGPELQTMRRLDREFGDQAVAERAARFPVLTSANAQAAIDFQERRIVELRDGNAEYQAALATVKKGSR